MMKRGFTLIEILVTLVIVSVGMLALGSFYTQMIMQEGVAQERILAVHMAEQLIEDWEANNNTLPKANCMVAGMATKVPMIIGQSTCVDATGIPIAYSIVLSERVAKAPLPVSHPNNPSLNVANSLGVAMYPMLTQSANGNVIANSPPVMVRSVKVSWTHDKTHTVQLTHITWYK